MLRFVGYHERRPYLWYVDLEDRVIEPAAELRDIPQGIDEVVPLEAAVAVRCGPTWFALEEDLSGQGRPLDRSEIALAEQGSARVDWPGPRSVHDAELVVPSPNGNQRAVSHPAIAYWQTFGTWAPDARTIAVGGFTQPFETPTKPIPGTYRPHPSVLALIDSVTGAVRACDGNFDNFCYPPAWSVDGSLIAFGAPFEPRRLYMVTPELGVLETVKFKRHTPLPLIDAARLKITM